MSDLDTSALDELTLEELEEFNRLNDDGPESLPTFFARVRPDLDYPEHLFGRGIDKEGRPALSLGETLAATINGPQQASFSTPPQFGKSILLLGSLAWYAQEVPGSFSAYVSYGDKIVNRQSNTCRAMCRAAGLSPRGPKSELTMANGSTISFASAGGPLEGMPVTGLEIYDDPYKSRKVAESQLERDTIYDWFQSTFLGRRHPSTSVFVVGHRWTADDLIANIDGMGFPWTNYPALWPDGSSLWEKFKPAAWLQAQKAVIRLITWESEYQGNPMARGGRLFEGVHYYAAKDPKPGEAQLPDRHLLNVAIGVDLAYSERTASDMSIAVVLAEYDAKWYVLEVLRRQAKADVFANELIALKKRYPLARMRWDGSTTERGAADVIRTLGKIDLQGVLATGKPLDRAQLSSAAWRRKAILVPNPATAGQSAPDIDEFVRVLTTFAGGEGAEDDDVVALASAFVQLPARALSPEAQFGSPEWILEQREKARQVAIRKVIEQQRIAGRGMRRGGR